MHLINMANIMCSPTPKLPHVKVWFVQTSIKCCALTTNSPSDHSGVLLHGGLQEALEDGPFSHGWAQEASTRRGKSGGGGGLSPVGRGTSAGGDVWVSPSPLVESR